MFALPEAEIHGHRTENEERVQAFPLRPCPPAMARADRPIYTHPYARGFALSPKGRAIRAFEARPVTRV
jgi:hypothetical protein